MGIQLLKIFLRGILMLMKAGCPVTVNHIKLLIIPNSMPSSEKTIVINIRRAPIKILLPAVVRLVTLPCRIIADFISED